MHCGVQRGTCVSNATLFRRTGVRAPNVLEIEETGLAHVLELGACLADFGLLEPHAGARAPPEDCERPLADLALLLVGWVGWDRMGSMGRT